jgi:hypothetical protein
MNGREGYKAQREQRHRYRRLSHCRRSSTMSSSYVVLAVRPSCLAAIPP